MPDELANLELEPIEGSVGVASFYTAPIDRASVEVDPDVTVTRTYGTDPAALHEGEAGGIILSADFGAQALDGCYQHTDLSCRLACGRSLRPSAWGILGRRDLSVSHRWPACQLLRFRYPEQPGRDVLGARHQHG